MDELKESAQWRRNTKWFGCMLSAFVLLPFLLVKACQWSDAHPADRTMVEEFNSNRKAFMSLLEMVREEQHVTRIAAGFIWIDGMQNVSEAERFHYLSDERLSRYRSLFEKLKLESGVIRYENGSVGFLRSSRGFVTGGSSKEFIWSRNMSAPVLAPTDNRSLEDACIPKTGCSALRLVAPEWYISLERH